MRRIARIVAQFGAVHRRCQPLPQRILVGPDHEFAVLAGIDVGRRDAFQDRSGTFADQAHPVIFGDQPFHHLQHAFIERGIDHLPLPGARPHVQRGQHTHAAIRRGQGIADRHAHPAGRAVRLAHDVAPAAHRLANPAEPGAVGVRPGLAIARHPRDDQVREFGQQHIRPQPPLFQRAGLEVFHQHVRRRDQPPHQRLPLGHAQVGADRALVARDHFPLDLFRALPPFAHRIAGNRRFDLDHIRAHVAQQLAAERPRDQLAQFDDPDVLQCPAIHLVPPLLRRLTHWSAPSCLGNGGALATMPGRVRSMIPPSQWLAAISAARSRPVPMPARSSM